MESPTFDVSFDASALLDDFALDDALASPKKKSPRRNGPVPFLSHDTTPKLPCLTALATAELFQVTHHLRDRSLHNDKIEKLVALLQENDDDLVLDDQLRTRVFRGRVARDRPLDALDLLLDNFLRQSPEKAAPRSPLRLRAAFNEANKENEVPMPSKRKLSDLQRKRPLKRLRGGIPLLQSPGMNGSTAEIDTSSPARSPQRVCVPKSVTLPGRACLKFRENMSIFLVDSLTGSVNDATQFGTELNSSNCEGFPLPDDVNEVVQIPTNDTVPASAAPKMAIIKAIHGRRFGPAGTAKKGFYTKQEFTDVKVKKAEIPIYNDSQKKVRFASVLEW